VAGQITAALVLLLYFYAIARHIRPTGDEIGYLNRMVLFHELVAHAARLDWAAAGDALDGIIDRGWFMPGMSLVVALGASVTNSIAMLRLYVGALNFVLVCLILRYLRDGFGLKAQTIFLCATLIVPYYAIYVFLFWSDLLAAHALLLLGLFAIRQIEGCGGEGLSIRVGAVFGLSLAFLTYLRGSLWLCLPLLLACVFFSSFGLASMRARFRHLLVVGGTCSLIFFLLLAPWTILVSQRHGFHITTTSMTMSQIIVFGSRGYLRSAGDPSEPNVYYRVHDHIEERARRAGTSFGSQARQELKSATAGLTLGVYLRRVKQNFGTYLLDSEGFIGRFRMVSRHSEQPRSIELRERFFDFAEAFNHWVWRLMLLCGIVLFVAPIEWDRRSLVQSTLFKYVVFLFSCQPFVVVAHGRYYVQYIPFIAMAMAAAVARGRLSLPARRATSVDEWIVFAGQVFALAFGAVLLATAAIVG
jgi:hypothetical protein